MAKMFDDYIPVDCNDCQHYWNDACDGVQAADREVPCTSYIATRTSDIPKRIERLEEDVESLGKNAIVFDVIIILMLISDLIWG